MALSKVNPNFVNVSQVGGRRNLITNGAMQVDQRNNGSVTLGTTSSFIVDQMRALRTGSAVMTAEKSTDAPDGFTNSCKVTVTTGAAQVATDYSQFSTRLEGYNTAFLDFGSSAAKTVTLSFYVKSSLTGNFGLAFTNSAVDKNYNTSYTINSANTWERKTITIDGATDGTWATNNTASFNLYWDLGIGTTYSTSNSNQWITDFDFGLTGGTKLSETTGATWQIAGIQLEAGDTATPFEHRSYGEELAACQRYYTVIGPGTGRIIGYGFSWNATEVNVEADLPQVLRASPTITFSNNAGDFAFQPYNCTFSTFTAGQFWSSEVGNRVNLYKSGGLSVSLTQGQSGYVRLMNSTSKIEFDSEL